MNKAVKQLVKALKKQGAVIDTKGKHLRIYGPGGAKPFVVVARTPSDTRSLKNARAQLRRVHGYDV